MNEQLLSYLAGLLSKIPVLAKLPGPIVSTIEKQAYKLMVEKGDTAQFSRHELEDKFYIAANVVRAALKGYSRGSSAVRRELAEIFLKGFFGPTEGMKKFKEKYGDEPPSFLVIAPTGFCNLKCKGCYAVSAPIKSLGSLTAEEFDWILTSKYNEWGSWFTVITGGEPYIWRDGDIDFVEMARRHPESYFMTYTNGTLIDKKLAKRIAEVGNITPAISLEGFEKETDERRGKGTYRKILSAMDNLLEVGVPFGISVTAVPTNAELILSDEFLDFFFNEKGALYQWIFQYMPIGRGIEVSRQISPEMRRKMWYREQVLVREKRLFVADFWNSGPFSSGCIAGGRSGGYFYIDWKGRVTPCAFVPFYVDNIRDLRANGKTLTDALFSDYLKAVRCWQRSYNYKKPVNERGNEIRPCIIRDHHEAIHKIVLETNAKPLDENAEYVLTDPSYYEGMLKYDKETAELLDPIWEELYRDKVAVPER